MLGVSAYGVLEFANSIVVYLLLIGEAGLDRWGVRAAAQEPDSAKLAGQFLPLRLLLAAATYVLLLLCLPLFPHFAQLRPALIIFGLILFAQAWNLKWVFMGRQEMSRVGIGLALYQAAFAVAIFFFVHDDADLLKVAALRFASELLLAAYFALHFAKQIGPIRFSFRMADSLKQLRPALTMGAAQFLSLLNYNFDAVLIGYLLSEREVGWYGAAYKPVTVALAIPLTYYLGYYSVLSRAHSEGSEPFRKLVEHSLRLTSIFALPLGIGASLLAQPILGLLYGPSYAPAIPVLQVLAWSAVLVILRGNYRHALHASGKQDVDLRFSCLATGTNIVLNVLWIPRFGMIGAAWATLISEVLWLLLSWIGYRRNIGPMHLLPYLWRPLVAGAGMATILLYGWPTMWIVRAVLASLLYFFVLWILRDSEVTKWIAMWVKRNTNSSQTQPPLP